MLEAEEGLLDLTGVVLVLGVLKLCETGARRLRNGFGGKR